MRLAVVLPLCLLAAYPAAAQTPCDASVTGKPGEVMVASDGADRLVSWAVEPKAGVGVESTHFSRPGLLLDFDVKASGLAVSGILTTVTRISDADRGQAPDLSRVRMRAIGAGNPLEWSANEPETGEVELLNRLKARWPATLQLDVLLGDQVVAASEFDLDVMPEVERLAREAMGKCRG